MPSFTFSAQPLSVTITFSPRHSFTLDQERLSILAFLAPFFLVYFRVMSSWWHPIRAITALAMGAVGAASLYLVCSMFSRTDRPKAKPAPSYYKMPGGHKTMISGWQHPAAAAAANETNDTDGLDTPIDEQQQQLLKPIEEEKEPSSPQPTSSPFLPARPAKAQHQQQQQQQPTRERAESDAEREARLQRALQDKATKLQNYNRVHAELLHTERTYITALNNALTCYIQPLQQRINKGDLKVTPADCATMFANLQGILQFHELFERDLIDGQREEVGAIVLKYADYLKMYTAYVTNYTNCVALVNKLSMQKDFSKFLTQQRASKASNGLDLMSYLIQPVSSHNNHTICCRLPALLYADRSLTACSVEILSLLCRRLLL